MAKRVVFVVTTPLGYDVVLTRNRWREIVRQKRHGTVDRVRVYYDRVGNTLSVWFDDPKKEFVCEELGDDVIVVKDKRGRIIGFERLNYLSRRQHDSGETLPVEVQML